MGMMHNYCGVRTRVARIDAEKSSVSYRESGEAAVADVPWQEVGKPALRLAKCESH